MKRDICVCRASGISIDTMTHDRNFGRLQTHTTRVRSCVVLTTQREFECLPTCLSTFTHDPPPLHLHALHLHGPASPTISFSTHMFGNHVILHVCGRTFHAHVPDPHCPASIRMCPAITMAGSRFGYTAQCGRPFESLMIHVFAPTRTVTA